MCFSKGGILWRFVIKICLIKCSTEEIRTQWQNFLQDPRILSLKLMLATFIQRYDKKSFHFKNERLTEILKAVLHFMSVLISYINFIKPFLDNKMSNFEEYGAFKICAYLYLGYSLKIHQMMLMPCFCVFFSSDFLYKSICCGYSFELQWQVDAIQMSTHNICFYKVVDKKYTGSLWAVSSESTLFAKMSVLVYRVERI